MATHFIQCKIPLSSSHIPYGWYAEHWLEPFRSSTQVKFLTNVVKGLLEKVLAL